MGKKKDRDERIARNKAAKNPARGAVGKNGGAAHGNNDNANGNNNPQLLHGAPG